MSIPNAIVPASNGSGTGMFRCGSCSQSYSRLDHLARHVRSHTKEKPYQCKHCGKQFHRLDLLRRHSLLHSATADDPPNKRRRVKTNPGSLRTSKACDACAEQHMKCEEQKPCRTCIKRNLTCVVGALPVVGETDSLFPPQSVGLDQDVAFDLMSVPTSPVQSLVNNGKSTEQDAMVNGNGRQYNNPVPSSVEPSLTLAPACTPDLLARSNDRLQMQAESSNGHGETMDFFPSGMITPNMSGDVLIPNGLIGFGIETDLDFNALDLSFLDTYNTRVPFEFDNPIQEAAPPLQEGPQAGTNEAQEFRDVQPGQQSSATQQNIWRFVPAPRDHRYADQVNLSLPDQDQIVSSPENFAAVERQTTEKLDSQTRDKMLGIIFSQVQSHMLPALSSFPSIELLDKLIQFFLAGPNLNARSWFHTAGFRSKSTDPVLLLTIAAAGAVLTPDRSLQKLGFAIQEIIRNYIPSIFEADNTKIRSLELQQAFMLQLDIGLWSGNSRKIEISESFQQPLLTMLRRGGLFKRSSFPTIAVSPEDEGAELDKKWRSWIQQESQKRLVYQLLGHDARVSISLIVSPLVSYSELDLTLPESNELWNASTAREWKYLYCDRSDSAQIPSLADCVADLNLLENTKSHIDVQLSCSAFLYAVWGMVWEYRKLSYLFRSQSNIWNSALGLTIRYQELVKVLDYYRLSYVGESTLLLELILMHLNTSLKELSLFAELEGLGKAQQAYLSVREWASSKFARQAVWHAGQLVRAARTLPSGQLRDFNSVAVFHASLTCWAYAQGCRLLAPERTAPEELERVQIPHASQIVWLDDEETTVTYRYISLGRGQPALHRADAEEGSPVLLSSPRPVMEMFIHLLVRGDGELSRHYSPLVENLTRVMERLRDTAV